MSFQIIIAKPFLALYGPPQTDDPQTFFAEWKSRFDGCDAEMLSAAVKLTIDRHSYPTWPTIGEFRLVLEEVSEKIAARRRWDCANALPPPKERERTSREKARMDAMFKDLLRSLQSQSFDGVGAQGQRQPRPRGGYAVPNDRAAWEARRRRGDAAKRWTGVLISDRDTRRIEWQA